MTIAKNDVEFMFVFSTNDTSIRYAFSFPLCFSFYGIKFAATVFGIKGKEKNLINRINIQRIGIFKVIGK